jgi:hypothetical protein
MSDLPLVRLSVNDSLEFLLQPDFAKLSIIHVRFAGAILESLSFPVYVCEWVRVLLIFHDVSPLTRILRLVHGQHGEFKVLVCEHETALFANRAKSVGRWLLS